MKKKYYTTQEKMAFYENKLNELRKRAEDPDYKEFIHPNDSNDKISDKEFWNQVKYLESLLKHLKYAYYNKDRR